MDKLDVLYRAFKKYYEEIKPNKDINRDINNYKKDYTNDFFKVVKYICHIDEQWIIEIEKGLPFIEKAIAEERQFIRTNSEVVDIEKVKRVGRESVQHLAKHSDLITKIPKDGEDIIPEQILMVEKDSDYGVYENRFLYMLLCYLRDFIALRLNKIRKLLGLYEADFAIEKKLQNDNYNVEIKLNIKDSRKNNPYNLLDTTNKNLLKRINDCEQIVNSLLNRPLIVEVSKITPLKPPIVKTNALKNDNNFKKTVELYEFIANYNEDGFNSEKIIHNLTPFADEMGNVLSNIPVISSFLSYLYGNNLLNLLEENYQNEEKRRQEEALLEEAKQIKRLKQKIAEANDGDIYKYILLLEKNNMFLTEQLTDKKILEDKLLLLNKGYLEIENEKNNLERTLKTLNETLKIKVNEYENRLKDLEIEWENKVYDTRNTLEKEIQNLNKEYELQINDLEATIKEKEFALNDYEDNLEEYRKKIVDELNQEYKEKEESLSLEKNEFAEKELEFKELQALRNAEYKAIMAENNKLDLDYTSKEKFGELEQDFLTFTKFFEKNWQKTKKAIRKKILWTKKKQ